MHAIIVLGSPGSIDVSTLDVRASHHDRYQVFPLSANQQCQLLASQCLQHHPRYAVLNDVEAVHRLTEVLAHPGCRTEVLLGPAALEAIAAHPDTDTVMAATVGAAGLLPALAAAKTGKKILLANKEALVIADG